VAVVAGLGPRGDRLSSEAVEDGGEEASKLRPDVGFEGAKAPDLVARALLVGLGRRSDPARLGPCFLHDQIGLSVGPSTELVGHPLCREKGVTERLLDLPLALKLAFEAFDLVAEVCAVAPHVFEARGDVLEQPIHGRPLVSERAATQSDVPNFDRGERHGTEDFGARSQTPSRA
jgi:hypothetical protein